MCVSIYHSYTTTVQHSNEHFSTLNNTSVVLPTWESKETSSKWTPLKTELQTVRLTTSRSSLFVFKSDVIEQFPWFRNKGEKKHWIFVCKQECIYLLLDIYILMGFFNLDTWPTLFLIITFLKINALLNHTTWSKRFWTIQSHSKGNMHFQVWVQSAVQKP